jgi:hypothetical protein
MKASTAVTIAVVGVGAGVATAAIVESRRDWSRRSVADPRVSYGGHPVVRVERNRLVVDSLDRWRDFAAPAIEDALRMGFRDASSVLASVMRRALPRMPWPPAPDSPLFHQWQQMVADVAATLHFDTEPEPRPSGRPHLQVIR